MENRPAGTELFYAYERTDTKTHRHDGANCAFQNSANVPNIIYVSTLIMNQMHTRSTVALHMYISLSVKSLTPTRNSTI